MEAPSTPPAPRQARFGTVAAGAAALVLVLAVAGGAFFLGRNSASSETATAVNSEFDYATLNQIRELLDRNYVKPDNLDDQTLFDAAINGMLSVLDDYGTYYVPPQDYQIDTIATGSFDGIGATVAQQNNEIVIVAPIKDTPAERAGLQAGDVILSVDGEDVTGWSVDRAVLRIRGPKGSQVTIMVRHPDGKTQEYKLTREQVLVSSVTTTPPSGTLRDSTGAAASGIGYIHIREFSARTDTELQAAIKEVQDAGARGLIIDVRSNLGGLLDPTLKSIDLFLDSGTMIVQRDPNGREQSAAARPGQLTSGMPIVVLQDRYSASAAEVLAAALQDNNRATVIGEKSFGKGTVNVTRELANGGALRVSIAQWLTPNKTLIDHVGVEPDIRVIPTDEDIDLRRDSQLIRAVDVLKEQMR